MKNLLVILTVSLWSGANALAQTPPPAPSAPSQPSPPIVAAPAPGEPMSFSFFLEGGNFLGVQPEEINRENMGRYGMSQPRGVGVGGVSKDSPAERAGLRKGDVILELDGEAVTSTRKLMRLISEAAPEQSVRLTVSRNGSEQQLTATLGKREAARAGSWGVMPAEPGEFEFEFPPAAPRAPRAGRAPESEVFSFGFGNRRVGILTTPLTKQLAEHLGVNGGKGVLVTSVNENSPAAKAGLRAGDVITEVNGASVEDSGDFIRELNRRDEGEVTLTVVRDKSQRTIKVTPERRPTPSFNLTDLQPVPMARLRISPRAQVEAVHRALQAMPRVQSFALPKLQKLVLPRVIKLPRIAPLPAGTDYYFD
ncbi:MAG TPA: PDZ domain-containing protein [Pyrinomonadaceae bacterium]|nr:PDZ domain-containing protein [Pyrinomonadaceae bacterium]